MSKASKLSKEKSVSQKSMNKDTSQLDIDSIEKNLENEDMLAMT
jgi:hypothetical protein